MKKLESSLLNMVLVLTGVAVIMGGILAFVNHLTEGPIADQKAKALADGIKSVMCVDDLQVANTDTVKQTDAKGKELVYVIYETKDAQGKDLGAAVESTTGGFGGNLKVLVGFNTEGQILGYTLLEHAETPGLGAKADKWFQKGEKGDIIGLTPAQPLTVSKDGGKVDAIYVPTDNIIASSIPTLMAVANREKIPVYGAEVGHVKNGVLASESISFYDIGHRAGQMAAEILKGNKTVKDFPVEGADKTKLYINQSEMETLGIQIPKEVLDRAEMI